LDPEYLSWWHGDCGSPLVLHLPPPRDVDAEFHRRGFILVPDFLSAAATSALSRLAADLRVRVGVRVERAANSDPLRYDVVTGDRIRFAAPALFDLYSSARVLDWVRRVTHCASVNVSAHLRSAVNVNCLSRVGQCYPPHTDAVPYTAVLFLSSLPATAGGELAIHALDGEVVSITPRGGLLLLMDGARCRHAVAPLREETMRLSVPMVYPAHRVERPAGLDEFLYGGSALRVGTDGTDRRTGHNAPRNR
jgi:hypothetical protein